ncbi:MAG: glycosyltransferase family 4 protein [Promethearchaeota archaeon]
MLNLPVGGVASQILELLPAYEKIKNLNVYLITKYSEYIPTSKNIKIIRIHKFRNRKIDEIYFFFRSYIKILKIHQKEHIHAINIHTYYYNLINPFTLRILYKIPLLITTPGDFSSHQREQFMLKPNSLLVKMFYYGWINFFKKFLIKYKNVFIQAINEKIFQNFINLGIYNKNIIKIPNGISCKNYNEIKKPQGKESYFGYVGRLIKSKNIRFLLRSFKLYLSDFPNDKLLIFGKGPEEKFILKFIKENNLGNNIIFRDFERNKKKIYSEINVLINPSFGEGVPMTILEAILTNTFIIASNVSGINDIIENKVSGLLFNPFIREDLIKQLKYYKVSSDLVKNMKVNARNKILNYYDINVISKQIYEFLKSRIDFK